eukprot:15029936-Alexandrium_andersonii.AAC.1
MGNDHPSTVVGLREEAGDVTGCHEEIRKDQGLRRPADTRRQVVNVGGRRGPRSVRSAHHHR